mmetsp:Transcript_12218/g.26299  ORF Transcript_12218/g.26299 Transcript_12218/m.26299 type:complete len:417 (+) Transcript_12218:295-1545(+)
MEVGTSEQLAQLEAQAQGQLERALTTHKYKQVLKLEDPTSLGGFGAFLDKAQATLKKARAFFGQGQEDDIPESAVKAHRQAMMARKLEAAQRNGNTRARRSSVTSYTVNLLAPSGGATSDSSPRSSTTTAAPYGDIAADITATSVSEPGLSYAYHQDTPDTANERLNRFRHVAHLHVPMYSAEVDADHCDSPPGPAGGTQASLRGSMARGSPHGHHTYERMEGGSNCGSPIGGAYYRSGLSGSGNGTPTRRDSLGMLKLPTITSPSARSSPSQLSISQFRDLSRANSKELSEGQGSPVQQGVVRLPRLADMLPEREAANLEAAYAELSPAQPARRQQGLRRASVEVPHMVRERDREESWKCAYTGTQYRKKEMNKEYKQDDNMGADFEKQLNISDLSSRFVQGKQRRASIALHIQS